MLHANAVAVCSEIQTEHINSLCGEKAEFLKGKVGGADPSGLVV